VRNATGTPPGTARAIWLGAYIAVFSLIGATVWITGGLREPPFHGLPNVPIWIFPLLTVAIHSRPVYIHTRRIGVMGISPLESAYLFSLLLAPPWVVIVSVLLGNVGYAVFGPRRGRGAPTRLWFNASCHLTANGLGLVTLHALLPATGSVLGSRGMLACIAAALVISTITTVPTHVAVWLSGGGFDVRPLITGLVIDLGFVVVQAGLVLIALLILLNNPALLWALAAPSLLLMVVTRSYQSTIEQNNRMQTLSAVILALQRGETIEETLGPVLTELATLLRAELVQLDFHTHDAPFRSTVAYGELCEHMVPILDDDTPAIPEGGLILAVFPISEYEALAAKRYLKGGLIVPLSAGRRTIGSLLVGNLTLNEHKFTRSDLGLLDTIAAQIAAVIERHEKDRIEQSADRLYFEATHDTLTGLANRRDFHQRLHDALCRLERSPGTLALLYIDIDGFKVANDRFGHAAGDRILVTIAERLQGLTRRTETSFRLGGDEFCVLLDPLKSDQEPFIAADRILGSLGTAIRMGPGEIRLSASIGIALCNTATTTTQEFLDNADSAMYAAKRAGKDRWQLFDDAAVTPGRAA
jgi:diguanylate cyclase (GGDEF)-like protein